MWRRLLVVLVVFGMAFTVAAQCDGDGTNTATCSSDDTDGVDVTGDDATVTIEENVTVSGGTDKPPPPGEPPAPGADMNTVGHDGGNGVTVEGGGNIQSESVGIGSDSGSVTNNLEGTVQGGLAGVGGATGVTNNGNVEAGGVGLISPGDIENNGTVDSGHDGIVNPSDVPINPDITNTGTVTANNDGVFTNTEGTVSNSGDISGGQQGINAPNARVENSGNVHGGVVGITGNDVVNSGNVTTDAASPDDNMNGGVEIVGEGGTFVNTPSGTVEFQVGSGPGSNIINNQGTINGRVATGDGNDTIINSGTIIGEIWADHGDDTVIIRGGVVGNVIDGGAGNDTLAFEMTVSRDEYDRAEAILNSSNAGKGSLTINGNSYNWENFEELLNLLQWAAETGAAVDIDAEELAELERRAREVTGSSNAASARTFFDSITDPTKLTVINTTTGQLIATILLDDLPTTFGAEGGMLFDDNPADGWAVRVFALHDVADGKVKYQINIYFNGVLVDDSQTFVR